MARLLSEQTLDAIEALCARYPSRLAALLGALHLVQNELGHIPAQAQLEVAEKLDVPPPRVHEAVSFYTMFRDQPAGRHVVKMCRNAACQLRGADALMQHAREVLGVDWGETTADGRITLEHEECLASCGTAPVLWCDDALVENLTQEKLDAFLAGLK